MAIPDAQAGTAALLRGLAGADPVETHISLVFLGADTVWKLKKAVRLSFLDFTTLDDRKRYIDRELALNFPHAPGLYRDVVPVVRTADGTLALGGEGTVVDWVLRMARVPAGDFMDEVADQGRMTPALLDALGDTVAAYHAALPPLPDAQPDMDRVIAGNTRAALEAGLPEDRVNAWSTAALAATAALMPWLRDRAAAGFLRRGHGDLHLGNLCLWQGHPVPFDALEFDEALATLDLGYDLAFLLMDLEFRCGRAAANRVLNRYVARTGDAALVRGMRLFLSSRALIRAHVAARSGRMDRGLAYLTAAEGYLAPAPAMIVAIGGLPGTGKSTLARTLAPGLGAAPGALILRSDEIRKRRFGVAPEERLPEKAYASSVGRQVFATLTRDAATAAAGGQVVIADGTFMADTHRAAIEAAAREAGVPFAGLWLTAPLPVLEARVAGRSGDASDATVEVLRRAAGLNPGPGTWHLIDTTDGNAARDLASATLRAHLVLPQTQTRVAEKGP